MKYLGQFNWHPVILTVKNGYYSNTDASLFDNIPEGIQVYKARSIEPFQVYDLLRGGRRKSKQIGMGDIKDHHSFLVRAANYIRANWFIPDARKGWKIMAIPKASKIIKEENVDAIVTTGPPHSTHLIGLYLKRKYKIPWLADLRDPWTTIYYNEFLHRTASSKARDFKLESEVLSTADHITVVSHSLEKEFRDRSRKISVVSNGYDPDDFPNLVIQPNANFYLSYIGNFKYNQNIETLWRSISELKKNHDEFSRFKIRFIGNINTQILKAIDKWELLEMTEKIPYVSHEKAIRFMMSSDLLLLPIPQAKSAKSLITGKIFEYIASGSAILAIGPTDGDAAAILKICNKHQMLDYEDYESIKSRIKSQYFQWLKTGTSIKTRSKAQEKFSRVALTEHMSQILNQITVPGA